VRTLPRARARRGRGDGRGGARTPRDDRTRECNACIARVRGGEPGEVRALGDIEELETAVACDNRSCATLYRRLANDEQRRRAK